jgi:hypothetical protein
MNCLIVARPSISFDSVIYSNDRIVGTSLLSYRLESDMPPSLHDVGSYSMSSLLIFSSLLIVHLVLLFITHNYVLLTSLFGKKKSTDSSRKVFTASIFCTVSSDEDIIFPSQTSISLSLNFADLSLTVLRVAIGALRYIIDSGLVKFGIASPRN